MIKYYKFKKPRPSRDFAWFLGVMAGDGYTSKYYLGLRTIDKTFAEKFSDIGHRLFNLKPKLSIEVPKRRSCKKVFRVRIFSFKLVQYFGKWKKAEGDWINDLKNKFIWILSKRSYLISFLKGLFDSEGSVVCNEKYCYPLACIHFAAKPISSRKFIYFCLQNLGIRCRIYSTGIDISGVGECKKFAHLIHSFIPRREERLEILRKTVIISNSVRHRSYNTVQKLKLSGLSNGEIYRKLAKSGVSEATMRLWLLHGVKPKPIIIMPEVENYY